MRLHPALEFVQQDQCEKTGKDVAAYRGVVMVKDRSRREKALDVSEETSDSPQFLVPERYVGSEQVQIRAQDESSVVVRVGLHLLAVDLEPVAPRLQEAAQPYVLNLMSSMILRDSRTKTCMNTPCPGVPSVPVRAVSPNAPALRGCLLRV